MLNKARYISILIELLQEQYNSIKLRGSSSSETQHFLDGYLKAARALDAIEYKELEEVIAKTHFEIFGKTLAERRKSELVESDLNENSLKVPAYIRKGELLK